MASSKPKPPPPPPHLPHKIRETWVEALGRQLEVLEEIAGDRKAPHGKRLRAIELIAHFAGGKPKPPKHKHDDND